MVNFEYDEFAEASEEYRPPESDSYFLKAQEDIRSIYEDNRESIFYIRQLQLKFEKEYFHWITNNALLGLLEVGYLRDIRITREKGTSTRFFIHRSNRYVKREMNKIEKIIKEYSQSHITKGCGHRAEDLFLKAFAMRRFMTLSSKVREHNGIKWEETKHDLDFVFSRDGVDYGCEIKNTLGYIDKEELDIKLKMCAHFRVRPLFIMRYAPKSYIELIYRYGGYAMIFETQIYELGQEKLVKKLKEKLGLPVICSKAIPDGIIDRFERWHLTKIP